MKSMKSDYESRIRSFQLSAEGQLYSMMEEQSKVAILDRSFFLCQTNANLVFPLSNERENSRAGVSAVAEILKF